MPIHILNTAMPCDQPPITGKDKANFSPAELVCWTELSNYPPAEGRQGGAPPPKKRKNNCILMYSQMLFFLYTSCSKLFRFGRIRNDFHLEKGGV